MGKKAYMGPMQDPNGINAQILPIWVPYIHVYWVMISLIINFLKLFQVYFNPNNYFDITGWSCELDFLILKSG